MNPPRDCGSVLLPANRLTTPSDHNLSPFTGYTRRHWIEIAEKIIAGFMRFVDPETGVPSLTGDSTETAHHQQLVNPGGAREAFERTHLFTAAYIAATGKTTVPGFSGDLAESYLRGVASLTDPKNAARFPVRPTHEFGMGASISMSWAPSLLLDPLDARARKNLADQLTPLINRKQKDTNWLLFSMMPSIPMERIGAAYNRDMLDGYFDMILGMYRGDGWFGDGWNRSIDYYNIWAFIFYLNHLVHYDPKWRARFGDRVREITRAHEETLPYLFDREGGMIPKGRSLCYRFAAISGIGAAQLSGYSAMDPGLARRISSANLKYFWERNARDERGLLGVGYHGGNSAVGEDYNDYGGPYWAGTGLAALALPEDHPFWTAPEKPSVADNPGIKRRPVHGARAVLKADGRRGEARWLNAGEDILHRKVWQCGSKYFQHTYSSQIGLALAGDRGPELPAGRTGISTDGKNWAYRTWPRVLELREDRAVSAWEAWVGNESLTGRVFTESLLLDDGELHTFWHESDGPRFLALGGYAVQIPHGEQPRIETASGRILLQSTRMWSVLEIRGEAPGTVAVEEVRPRPGFAHSHLFGGWAAFTIWKSTRPVAPGVKISIWVDAGLGKFNP